jgi:predicted DNA-binding transcriptional regulator YafY
MRADRLLAILIYLQSRGMSTARDLARELEVSERTIYRDMDVLSGAGFPIYAETGKGGGFALLENYELSLSGLNTRDIQALATLHIPESLDEIGLGAALRTALLKLLTAVDDPSRHDQDWMRQRLLMDMHQRKGPSEAVSNLPEIQQGVWEDRKISCVLRYPIHFGQSEPIILAPLTLIAAGPTWYLIGARRDFIRVYPLKQLQDVSLLDETFTRPRGYCPQRVWQSWKWVQNDNRPRYTVKLRIQPDALAWFKWILDSGEEIRSRGEVDRNGWEIIEIDFDGLYQARTQLLGLGGAVQVLEPKALRLSIVDYAKQITLVYPDPES